MSSIDHLRNETEMLTVKQHSDLHSAQYTGSVPGPKSCMPQHHHDGCSTAPDEAYSTHQTLSNSPTAAGCYKEGDAPGCTHRGCHQGYQQPNRVLHNRPPPISLEEDTLRRPQRTTLSQLRSGHCQLLNSYQNRLKPTVDPRCPDCGVNPPDVPHLFNCTAHPNDLSTVNLWDKPVESIRELSFRPKKPGLTKRTG